MVNPQLKVETPRFIAELQARATMAPVAETAREEEDLALELRGLSVWYGSFQALRDVSLRIGPGEKIALEVVRHHRLLEAYLTSALGFSWDEVHAEADHLEHVISEDLEERIAAYLGNPAADPHGAPIPERDGSLPVRREVRLSDLEVGAEAVVVRVSDRDPELLRYLDRLGLRPPSRLRLLERGPFDGPLHIEAVDSGAIVPLSRRVTDEVFVLPESIVEGA